MVRFSIRAQRLHECRYAKRPGAICTPARSSSEDFPVSACAVVPDAAEGSEKDRRGPGETDQRPQSVDIFATCSVGVYKYGQFPTTHSSQGSVQLLPERLGELLCRSDLNSLCVGLAGCFTGREMKGVLCSQRHCFLFARRGREVWCHHYDKACSNNCARTVACIMFVGLKKLLPPPTLLRFYGAGLKPPHVPFVFRRHIR